MDDSHITSWSKVIPWWYQSVPRELSTQQRLLISTVVDYFSFSILIKTLFLPWKHDQISTDRLTLQQRFEVWGLNLMSRLIGAVVRAGAIMVGIAVLVALITLFSLLWLSWVLAPLLGVGLTVLGVVSIFGGIR